MKPKDELRWEAQKKKPNSQNNDHYIEQEFWIAHWGTGFYRVELDEAVQWTASWGLVLPGDIYWYHFNPKWSDKWDAQFYCNNHRLSNPWSLKN